MHVAIIIGVVCEWRLSPCRMGHHIPRIQKCHNHDEWVGGYIIIYAGKDDFLTEAIPIEACQLACMYLPHIGASRKNS